MYRVREGMALGLKGEIKYTDGYFECNVDLHLLRVYLVWWYFVYLSHVHTVRHLGYTHPVAQSWVLLGTWIYVHCFVLFFKRAVFQVMGY